MWETGGGLLMGGDHLTDSERQQWQALGTKQRHIEATVRLAQHRLGELSPLPSSTFHALPWHSEADHAHALKRLRDHGERP